MITFLLRTAVAVVLTGAVVVSVVARAIGLIQDAQPFELWSDEDDWEFERFVEDLKEIED